MKLENVADIYALTPMQEGMLFHLISRPSSPVYFQQYVCTLTGRLDADILKEAWQQALVRHPVLRTAFLWEDLDAPLQIVREKVELPWEEMNWETLDEDEQAKRLEQLLAEDRTLNLDIAHAPLIRLKLIRLASDRHQLLWSYSHLILDGWSMRLVLQEVFASCQAVSQGKVGPETAPRPFRDYIAWLQDQDLSEAEDFWKNDLKGFSTPTTLDVDKRVKHRTLDETGHRQQQLILSEDATLALASMARHNALTLNTLVQGTWALLLNYYSGEEDLVFGTTVSGRPPTFEGFERMVGLFINTLPLRITIPPDTPLLAWLKRLQEKHVETRQYQCSPLASIQQWSEVQEGRPLFDSIVVFENHPSEISPETVSGGIEVHDQRYLEQSNYPLALLAVPGTALQLIIVYQDQHFDEAVITRMLGHMKTILESMPTRLDRPLADVPILSDNEQQQWLTGWNNTQAYTPVDKSIHELFEMQVMQTPHAEALIDQHERLDYHTLNRRANQLADHLISQGLQQGDLAAICMERSVEMIVAVMAVLKAGGGYIPLDPDYPDARLDYLMKDSGASLVLTLQNLSRKLAGSSIRILCLDTDRDAIASASDANPDRQIHPDCTAYVMYTSGSTGSPLGVRITHRNLVHSTMARKHYYPEPVTRFLLLSSFSFDSSAVGIYWSLCLGGTLILPPPGEEQDVLNLAQRIADLQITHMLALPALYDLLLTYAGKEQLTSLQTVIVAGEACPPLLPKKHYACLPEAVLYNEYGPTEGTIWSSVYKITSTWSGTTVPIGQAIPNTRLFILDSRLRPVPVGVSGELFIAGEGVAAGYLNRPEETAERFIDYDPGTGTALRLYKTGDLARYRDDGEIEFLGRKDHQIKIRGHRIELAEIESALARHPALKEVAVIVSEPTMSADLLERALDRLQALDPEEAERLLEEAETAHDA